MKRFVRRAAVIAALVAAPALASAPAFAADSAASKPKVSTSAMTQLETEVVRLTNVQRTAKGCPALRIDDRLIKAARAHSADMVAERFFDHTGSNGSTFVAREVAAGYPKRGASAENIAWGYRTAQEVVSRWMNSPGHRANILNCGSIAVGVGVAYTAGGAPYYTQDFGRI
ncbi:CAP domain-containing protein [Paractinoplanes durhamensis]|uniref:SCP domain-containing protein n=1 Tax=Paractinoplanes durhamensis TaxID=113563 RepID=A0ABQ3YXN0_9ACTN|nr:CAP domain-containing protein [Actinoplanes durhamensis]GIE02326.1 hypothetical protein Adu01nite_36760 [Actinoplanes durhamensis]